MASRYAFGSHVLYVSLHVSNTNITQNITETRTGKNSVSIYTRTDQNITSDWPDSFQADMNELILV